ncbi:MAG: hypothetical protein A2167_05275 [Planctomycetes bacterium RBG_13_46_10]|nr:MAG: hypothetical protein A2167_05275 [Planctomycetes bacterium RBG_13_46_10]
MESQKYLGIYLSKDRATVVCIGSGARDGHVLGSFSVSVEEQQEQNQQQLLAELIIKGCVERNLKFSEVGVALDCALFMQHNMHSEFNNTKQIAATIRFDTEEALASDISDVAIAFQINRSSESGSELTVFTAKQKILSDILLSLQSKNIDPLTIEPDINCLSRYISKRVPQGESQDGATLFGLLSSRRGYFVTSSKSQKISSLRTFLVSPTQDRNELLTRQVLITTNLPETGEPTNYLRIFDSMNSVSHQQLGAKIGKEIEDVDLIGSAGITPAALVDCYDPVDFAIAYGAALAHLEKAQAQSVNFRSDFMPYQGKKLRMQKTLKFLSISVSVLLFALGLYCQAKLFMVNMSRTSLQKKFEPQYLAVMPGSKQLPDSFSEAVRKLGSELRRIRDVKSGLIGVQGEKSTSSKLTLVLEALNKCAAQTDLVIDSISITTTSISIAGETSSASSTQKLREALMEKKLGNLQERISPTKTGRNSFSITITPEK